ncbi:hypothetical protein [Ponticoccus litoralis]|uniref:Uncharacterized protein n=1 Tax=Ponticoccus litoralis TaxID=422297 RepID=A0AAW9SJB6_9RHOB
MKGPKGEVQVLPHSRLDEYLEAGEDPPLPDLPTGGEYLIEAMYVLSPIRVTGRGIAAADWPEIVAFAQGTRRVSDPCELEALHAMCAAYRDGLVSGANPFRKSPMEIAEDKPSR